METGAIKTKGVEISAGITGEISHGIFEETLGRISQKFCWICKEIFNECIENSMKELLKKFLKESPKFWKVLRD